MDDMDYEFTYGDSFVTIYLADGTTLSATADHPNFAAAHTALASGTKPPFSYMRNLLDLKAVIEKGIADHGHAEISVTDEGVFYKGEVLHTHLTARIISMLREGYDVTPMIHFLANLMQNPERRAVFELYGFLEKCGVPITNDGHFIAYKRVRGDYMDCYSGKFNNAPPKDGEEPRRVEIDRWKVDNNPNQTCSHGLHVCSRGYLHSYSGERVIICKVNPRDVVAIPTDYNNAKMRACGYWVIGEVNPADIDGHVNRIESAPVYTSDAGSWEPDEDPAETWVDEPTRDCGEPESECVCSADDDDNDATRANDDATAMLYVQDDFDDDQYYPATLRDMRSGAKLYVWDTQTLTYKSI